MDTQPKIPTLKDSQKPQVKIRGLEAGVTLFDRLKQFKKKDLAFILAGLGTLFMAPLAEHFMMSPESGSDTLQQGWGGKGAGGRGMFDGSGSSPYEPGTTGLAPGSAVGGGSDIITPLNVRDPSALVMGPGATQQPPTQSVMPSTPPPTAPASRSDSDLKDALAASARGVGAAAHAAKALLPVPKIALAGSGGLRGLGVVSGGTSATAGGGGPISSNGLVTGRANAGGGLTGARAPSGFKGVARGQTSGDASGMAALKAAGDAAASKFNGGSSAYQSATDAAATAIPTGGGALGGGGAGGVGATDKPFGGDQDKSSKNVGESLAFLKQKAMQEAQIALWAKEQEAGDNKLEALKIRNSMAEAFTSKLAGMAADQVGCMINSSSPNCPSPDAGKPDVLCDSGPGPTGGSPIPYKASSIAKDQTCTFPNQKPGEGSSSNHFYLQNGVMYTCSQPPTPVAHNCNQAGSTDGGNTQQNNNVDGLGGFNSGSSPSVTNLVSICQAADKNLQQINGLEPAAKATQADAVKFYNALKDQTKLLISGRDALFKGASGECGAEAINTKYGDSSYNSALEAAQKSVATTAGKSEKDASSAVAQMLAVVGQNDKPLEDGKIPGAAQLKSAETDRANAAAIMKAASDKIESEANPGLPTGWAAGTKAAQEAGTYTAKLTDAKSSLRSYVASLNDVVKDNGSLDQQHKLLEKIVNGGEAPSPTLKTVVSVNVAEAKAEADFKAAAGGDGAPAITPAKAEGDAPKGNYDGTSTAIKTAQGSVGADDSAGARKAVADFKAAPNDDTKKSAAQTALGNSSRDVGQMQNAQTGWLKDIGTSVRGISMPAATTP